MPTRESKSGSELFIVDNSDVDWKVHKYLHDWCQLSEKIDIATGYFEIGSLLALDGEWQKVDKIRILLGDEVTKRTKKAFSDGLAEISQRLDNSIESEKEKNDFLTGVPAIVEAIQSGKIECRVYRKDKFHAKAYITHAHLEVVGSSALVGSSNFTYPGLTENIELNVQITGGPVKVLQEWYEEHWDNAEDVSADLLMVIERHIAEYTPYEIYAKALYEFHKGHEQTASEWEKHKSVIYPILSRYQQDGYHSMMKIASQYQGAFLCDGVGLGKTFIGMMLLERLLVKEEKNVVLLVPKAANKPVWKASLRRFLPQLIDNPYINLTIYNHTDLCRAANNDRNYPVEFDWVMQSADAIVIDEAHHFRTPSSSRHKKLNEIINAGKKKNVYMLTATPINNDVHDLRHLTELFTDRDDRFFNTAPLSINSLRMHFNKIKASINKKLFGSGEGYAESSDSQEALSHDAFFSELVVQRSRSYVKESAKYYEEGNIMFPERKPPQVVPYSLSKTYGPLLKKIETAFSKERPLLKLPVYSLYEEAYYKGDLSLVDPMLLGRRKQIVGLIKILFLKRFESSVVSFEDTCKNILLKLLAFIELHQPEKSQRWKGQHAELMKRLLDVAETSEDTDEDVLPEELLGKWEKLDPDEFDIGEIISDVIMDIDLLAEFLDDLKEFDPSHDDKIQSLIKLLQDNEDLRTQKVLIFSEFMSTARYVEKQLKAAGIEGVSEIDSSYKGDRGVIIKRFSPYYNGTSPGELAEEGKEPIRVLVATDVLSEGLNLQDATLLINYDLHWNPVRLMQRIGRVDRRMNPALEERIKTETPDAAYLRGTSCFWNFLPPAEMNKILSLYNKVTHKTLQISATFGIEGKKLLTAEDDYAALKDFNHQYEGETSKPEQLHLDYQQILKDSPELVDRLEQFPLKVYSGKNHINKGSQQLFFCYRLPVQNKTTGEWSQNDGITCWYLYDLESNIIDGNAFGIAPMIKSEPVTQRALSFPEEKIVAARESMEKHLKNTYMKKANAPMVDANNKKLKPTLLCWMELN